jgi:hypothetical protein
MTVGIAIDAGGNLTDLIACEAPTAEVSDPQRVYGASGTIRDATDDHARRRIAQ